MTRLFTLLMFCCVVSIHMVSAQCNIKSEEQSNYKTYYMDPELVGQTNEIGVAMSVQQIGVNYYLAITYRFSGESVPVEEKVALGLKSGYTLELDMYTMQVGSAAGVQLCMAVFFLNDDQMNYFVKAPLTSVSFKTQQGKEYTVPATSNADVLMQQIKCFRK